MSSGDGVSPKAAPEEAAPTVLSTDRPVQRSADDLFRRGEFAAVIARHIGSAPVGDSMVFSLNGAWGAGKTSVLHMVEEHLDDKDIEVVWFNPWLFSGTEQIASQFMRELGLRLGSNESRFGKAGEYIETYGRLLEVGGTLFNLSALAAGLPGWAVIPGLTGAGVFSALGKAFKTVGKESVRDTRKRIEDALRKSGRRIVVFIDDIDRLDGDEIRLVFKMVRLVADFPSVSYVLAFDRPRVERAFGNEDLTGRAYLAKIVQASFDLPPLDPGVISSLLTKELARRLDGRTTGPLHHRDWTEVFARIVRPLVRHPRDVSRYLNAVVPAVDMLGEEVALEDVLALEAIRVFVPAAYDALPAYADVLAMGRYGGRRHSHQQAEAAKRVKDFIALDGGAEGVLTELCKALFPNSRFAIDNHVYDGSSLAGWRRDRRVAAAEVLQVYIERTLRPGTAQASLVRRVVAAFDNEVSVNEILRDLSPDELESTLVRLEDHTKSLGRMSFENGIVAVLQHADRLRRGRSHPFDFGADMAVSRLVLWTLRAVGDPARRLAALRSILDRTPSISWRADLVRLAQRSKDDDPLIDEAVAKAMLEVLRTEVLDSSPERFENEREPYLVARMAHDKETDTFDPRMKPFLEHTGFFRAMLTSLLSENMSWGMDSASFATKPSLPWSSLAKVAGGEDELRTILRAAIDAGPAPEGNERMATVLRMADDVLSGRKKMIGPEERVLHDMDDEADE